MLHFVGFFLFLSFQFWSCTKILVKETFWATSRAVLWVLPPNWALFDREVVNNKKCRTCCVVLLYLMHHFIHCLCITVTIDSYWQPLLTANGSASVTPSQSLVQEDDFFANIFFASQQWQKKTLVHGPTTYPLNSICFPLFRKLKNSEKVLCARQILLSFAATILQIWVPDIYLMNY